MVFAHRPLPYRKIDGFSIIHLGSSPVYLNEAGTLIWDLVDGKSTTDQIARALAKRFNLTEDRTEKLASKVENFLENLYTKKLLWRSTDGEFQEHSEKLVASKNDLLSESEIEGRSGGHLRPVQEECMTPKITRKAQTLSDHIEILYWKKYYIYKMHLELTYRCNFRCVHCYNPTHGGGRSEMATAEWERTLDQLADLGCYLLIFTGGELFVRKDAVQILQAACDKGFTFRLNTNGSLIDEKMIEQLDRMRPFLQSVDISFYGAEADVHDVLAQQPGSYAATLRAVNLLRDAGISLVTKFVTLRDNFRGIDQFENSMREIGVPHIVSTGSLIPRTDRNKSPLVQLTTDKQYETLLATRVGPKGDEDPGACRPGHVRGAITPDGFVSPCEWLTDFKLGNLREQTLSEIWYGPRFQSFRNIFEQESECTSCGLRPGCDRCPAHSYLETGNLLECAPNQRHYAEIYERYNRARS